MPASFSRLPNARAYARKDSEGAYKQRQTIAERRRNKWLRRHRETVLPTLNGDVIAIKPRIPAFLDLPPITSSSIAAGSSRTASCREAASGSGAESPRDRRPIVVKPAPELQRLIDDPLPLGIALDEARLEMQGQTAGPLIILFDEAWLERCQRYECQNSWADPAGPLIRVLDYHFPGRENYKGDDLCAGRAIAHLLHRLRSLCQETEEGGYNACDAGHYGGDGYNGDDYDDDNYVDYDGAEAVVVDDHYDGGEPVRTSLRLATFVSIVMDKPWRVIFDVRARNKGKVDLEGEERYRLEVLWGELQAFLAAVERAEWEATHDHYQRLVVD